MNFIEANQVFDRMQKAPRFRDLHVMRSRGEMDDQHFLRELDALQMVAEDIILEGHDRSPRTEKMLEQHYKKNA